MRWLSNLIDDVMGLLVLLLAAAVLTAGPIVILAFWLAENKEAYEFIWRP